MYQDYQASEKPLELVKNCDLPAIVLEIVILDHFPRMGAGRMAGRGTMEIQKLHLNFKRHKSLVLLEKAESNKTKYF